MPRNPIRVIIVSEIYKEYYIVFDGTYYSVRKSGVRLKEDGTTEDKEIVVFNYGRGLGACIMAISEDMMVSKAKAEANRVYILTLDAYVQELRKIRAELFALLKLTPTTEEIAAAAAEHSQMAGTKGR